MKNIQRKFFVIGTFALATFGMLVAKPARAGVTISMTSLTPANASTVTIPGTSGTVYATGSADVTTTGNNYSVDAGLAYIYGGTIWGSITTTGTPASANATTAVPLSFGYTLYALHYTVQYTVTAKPVGGRGSFSNVQANEFDVVQGP